jgi:hypothetical protein
MRYFCSRSVGSITCKLGPVKTGTKIGQVDAMSFDEYILDAANTALRQGTPLLTHLGLDVLVTDFALVKIT